MAYVGPYTADESYYECRDCGHRSIALTTPGACPECRGRVTNPAASRPGPLQSKSGRSSGGSYSASQST
ncbi:rubrerythrin-like domain-containing protein [Natrialbaceae archaeon A-gly3]